MHNEVKLAKKSMLSIKGKKFYITKYTYVCIVLAISYTKTKPKNDQLTFIKPKIYLIHSMIKRMQVSEKFSSGSDCMPLINRIR